MTSAQAQTRDTVSYTHLDVYKRQVLNSYDRISNRNAGQKIIGKESICMTTRKENIVIPKEAYVIWGKLSAFEKYPEWRADASEIEMIDEKSVSYTHLDVYKRQEKCFKESNREGYKTIFTIEKSVPLTCLKLCLENDSMTGYREFLLDSRGNETEIEITESVTSKRLSTRPIGKSVSERV